jgi:hypothetical protein
MAPFCSDSPLDPDASDVATFDVEDAVAASSMFALTEGASAAAVLQLADARFKMASALLKMAEEIRCDIAVTLDATTTLQERFEKHVQCVENFTAHGLVAMDLWLDERAQGT